MNTAMAFINSTERNTNENGRNELFNLISLKWTKVTNVRIYVTNDMWIKLVMIC